MMKESLDSRKFVQAKSLDDMPVPLSIVRKANASNTGIVSPIAVKKQTTTEDGSIKFALLSKKNNKNVTKDVMIPVHNPIASKSLEVNEEDEEIKKKIVQLSNMESKPKTGKVFWSKINLKNCLFKLTDTISIQNSRRKKKKKKKKKK